MNRKLHISEALSLFADAITQTFVIYGGKGMGKSNLAAVLCEELFKALLRFCVIDPMGVFWGLKHSANGKGKGIEVLILGGKHGDIPIDPTSGAAVADLVVDERISIIIDISRHADGRMWSVGERIRFVTDYFKRLYERQGEKSRPLMQFLDEAGRFCPQQIPKNPQIAACMGAIETAVEEGRNVGLGVNLITQRSARMNKSVSELAECMIAFRTVGPRSGAAIMDWLGDNVPKERHGALSDQLRKLDVGQALVVSPGWLKFEGVVQMRARETFDSSATPKAGKQRRAPGRGTQIDLDRFKAKMQEIVARVKAEDPKGLQRELTLAQGKIRVLSDQLGALDKLHKHIVDTLETELRTKKPAGLAKNDLKLLNRHIRRIELHSSGMDVRINKLDSIRDRLAQSQQVIVTTLGNVRAGLGMQKRPIPTEGQIDRMLERAVDIVSPGVPVRRSSLKLQRDHNAPPSSDGEEKITPAMQRILEALAYSHPHKLSRGRIAAQAGMTVRGGTFMAYFPRLVRMGLIHENGDLSGLTGKGVLLPGVREKLGVRKTPAEVRARWQNHRTMTPSMWKIIETSLALPNGISREFLAEKAGMQPRGGTFMAYFPKLKRMGLLIEQDGLVTPAPELIE